MIFNGFFFCLKNFLIILLIITPVIYGQRSPYAGRRPTGYKNRFTPETLAATNQVNGQDGIGNRFGGQIDPLAPTTTTQRIPYDAHGDYALVQQLNRLPVDQRPFWLINFEAIEAQRNPGTFNSGSHATGSRGSFAG